MPPSEQQWSAPQAGRYLADVAAGAGRRFRYRSRLGELLGRPAESRARPHAPVRPWPELLYRADALRLAAEEDGPPVARPAAATPSPLPAGPAPGAAAGPPVRPDTPGPTSVREILLPGPAARRPEPLAPESGRETAPRRPDRTVAAPAQPGPGPTATAPASDGQAPTRPSPAPSPPPRSRPGHPAPARLDTARTGSTLPGSTPLGSPPRSAARPDPEQPPTDRGSAEPDPSGVDRPSASQDGDRAATSPRNGDLPAPGRAPLPAAAAARWAPPRPDLVAHPATTPIAAPRATGPSPAPLAEPHAEPRAATTAPRQGSVALRPADRRPGGPDTAAQVRADHRLPPADPAPALRLGSHRAEPPAPSSAPARPVPLEAPPMPGRRPAPARPPAVPSAPSSPTAPGPSAVPTAQAPRPAPVVQVSRRTATRAVSRWDRSTLRRVGMRGLR